MADFRTVRRRRRTEGDHEGAQQGSSGVATFQCGRPRAWSPSSVREVLYRESYRGLIVYNKTKKRDAWCRKRQTTRPESEWLRTDAERLRIVPEPPWNAAHARLSRRAPTTTESMAGKRQTVAG